MGSSIAGILMPNRFPQSWDDIRKAQRWETMRASFWRRNHQPEMADYVQTMADQYRCQLIEHQQEVWS